MLEKNNYVIYRFTSPSGKSYIGQTNNLNRRVTEHQSKNSGCTVFSSAIKKHGFQNFTQETLKENLTVDAANHWEEIFIREHNTISPNGYNLRSGGGNSEIHESTKIKLSKLMSGEKNHQFGKTQSEETKNKRSNAVSGEKHPQFGKPKSKETKEKISKSLTGKKMNPDALLAMTIRMQTNHPMKGRSHSEDSKKRMSESAKNKPPMSDETRKKLSIAFRGENNPSFGKKKSAESIAKRTATRKTNQMKKIMENLAISEHRNLIGESK